MEPCLPRLESPLNASRLLVPDADAMLSAKPTADVNAQKWLHKGLCPGL